MIDELMKVVEESDALSNSAAEQFYSFAYAQYQGGDLKRAVEIFRVLCSRRPLEARNWFGLAAALQEERKYEAAMRAWAMAAIIEPENPYPHFHAAECSCSLMNLEDARLALGQAQKRIGENHPLKEKIPLLQDAWDLERCI
jgi:type III secretion system low calcium response chaperone LcrH/SycD